MPAIGSSFGLTLPTVGDTSWGGPLNTILSSLISAVEGTVSSGAILVNSNLDMSSYSLTSVNRVKLISQSATLSDTQTVYFYGGDLYITNDAGTAVQITSGNAIVAAAGNIGNSGGTYGDPGIELDWNGTTYEFKDGASSYAPILVDDVRMVDGSYYAGIEATAGMTASYTLSLPVELPASTRILQVGATGAISASNTVANAATFSGAVTCSSTLSALETSVTKLNFSTDRTLYLNLLENDWCNSLSPSNMSVNTSTGYVTSTSTSGYIYYPVHNIGRITEFGYSYKTSTAANELTSLVLTLYSPGTSTSVASTASTASESTTEILGPASSACTLTGPGVMKVEYATSGTITVTICSIWVKYDWV